jgi:hypothetical protein
LRVAGCEVRFKRHTAHGARHTVKGLIKLIEGTKAKG